MVQLTFMEEVKDKASRLIPTAYMEIVQEATAPHLSIPIYEHVGFLCDSANTKPAAIGDIVRALRRRITDDNPAVKHLTILLVDAMMKNCGSDFHVEVCNQKGILRDLVNLATEPPTSARGMQAKEAALTLVLNLSIWFAGHPNPACHLLTTLANDVRSVSGPNAFEGIRPDTNTHIRMNAPSSAPAPAGQKAGDRRKPRQKQERNYIDAILIDLPTEASLACMLDSCVAFSEYLNNATVTAEGYVVYDDVVTGFASKIEKDHDYVTILLSSNLQVDRDVLRSISDSQSSVLARLEAKAPRQAGPADIGGDAVSDAAVQIHMPQGPPTPSPAQPSPSSAAHVDSDAPQPTMAPTPLRTGVVPAASAEGSPAAASQAPAPPPDMDDIFGAPSSGPTSVSAAAVQPSAAAAPTVDDLFADQQPAPQTGEDGAAPAEAVEEAAAPPPDAEAVPDVAGSPSEAQAEAPAAEEQPADVAPATSSPPSAKAPAPAMAAADDADDDFDAFLDGKLKH